MKAGDKFFAYVVLDKVEGWAVCVHMTRAAARAWIEEKAHALARERGVPLDAAQSMYTTRRTKCILQES